MSIKEVLVDDFNKAHKWLSMRIMAFTATLPGGWLLLPDDWKAAVPKWVILVFTALCLSAMGARVTKQKGLHAAEPPAGNDSAT